MTSYAAEAFNSGLFSLLAVVLKPDAPGYAQFKRQAKDSWRDLGLEADAVDEVLFDRKRLSAEEYRSALREDMPLLIERSYGSDGRCFYELGFWYSTFSLALMANLDELVRDSLRSLKYKCAEARNPELLHDLIVKYEHELDSGGCPDLLHVMKSAEDIFLWLVANTSIERKRSLIDVIFEVSLDEVPYVGKPLRRFYQHLRGE